MAKAPSKSAEKSGGKPKIPPLGEKTAKLGDTAFDPAANPAAHVTTTRSSGLAGMQQGVGVNSPTHVQGDVVPATASEVQSIADRGKEETKAMKSFSKTAPKDDKRNGQPGRYKVSAGPGNNIPLIVNGVNREISIGRVYEFDANDFEILTNAGYTLDLQV